ncbi:MAG: hypothetical protein K2Q32_01470 [Alphaproteobacteria bacterium]|nr:hypothetical protein [Alphaproteobacteria bacterium]
MNKSKLIAHVSSNLPPENLKTVEDWVNWRAREDERMFAELFAQFVAHFERQLAGKFLH